MRKCVMFISIAVICMAGSQAAEVCSDDYLRMPVNISWHKYYSLGHLIGRGRLIRNHLSLNILSGRAAELQGIEISGIWGEYSGDVWGIQAAGIANVVGGNGSGIQAAGIANVIERSYIGVQVGGLANVVEENFGGIQIGGLANVIERNYIGVQVGGLANVVGEDFGGIQLGGLANVVNGNQTGLQAGGLANVVNGSLIGFQGSGLVNVVNGRFTGLQIGMINVLQNADRAIQIGIVNATDEKSVLPIGMISVARDLPTYNDVWVDENKFVNTGFRSGTEHFHNLVFVGAQINNPFRWTVGWGLGCHRDLNESSYLEVDALFQHINEDEFWTSEQNLVSRFRILGGWRLSDYVSIYGGPTFNYLISELNDGSDLASWSVSDKKSGDKWKRTWPGITVGVRILRTDDMFDFLPSLPDFGGWDF